MERVDTKSVEYILRELERLKIEIQRLEAMIIPVQRDPGITDEEIAELLKLAKDDSLENWTDAKKLPELEDWMTYWVRIHRQVEKALRNLPKAHYKKFLEFVSILEYEAVPRQKFDIIKLEGI